MANPATSLSDLVDQLRGTFSPFERLKILGRAWSLLRTMTPSQRLAVAAQLGLDQADEVVEAIAERGGGKASPVILSMIDQAQKKGTAHLPQLVNDLRDPGKRAERMRQGVMALEGAAVTAAAGGDVPWLPAGMTTAAPATPARPPQPVVPVPQPAPPAPPASAAAPPPAPPPVSAAPAPAPVPVPPAVQAAPAPEPKPVEAPTLQPAQPPKPQPTPAPVQSTARESLEDRLAAVPSLTARFRILRRHLPRLYAGTAGRCKPRNAGAAPHPALRATFSP